MRMVLSVISHVFFPNFASYVCRPGSAGECRIIAPLMISTLNSTQLSTHNYTGGLLSFKELIYIYCGS